MHGVHKGAGKRSYLMFSDFVRARSWVYLVAKHKMMEDFTEMAS